MKPMEQPIISLANVDHFYGSGNLRKQVLFDINCEISPGEIVIVTGPSGSGKTTILTLIGALRTVEHGSVRVIGSELCGASRNTLVHVRQNIGFIFQSHNLLDSLTALQNVEIAIGVDNFPSVPTARAAEVLEAVGMGGRLNHLPEQLSGGQRQRVAVARALVRDPKIILADEPTASLDKQSGREVVELLRQLARGQGCAVLMVTHDNRILDIADRTMRLEDGRLEAFGSATSPFAGHLLTVLSRIDDKDQLRLIFDRFSGGDFVEVFKSASNEVEQLLNVLDLGNRESLRTLLGNLLDTFLVKIAEEIQAEAAAVFDVNGAQLRVALASPVWAEPALTKQAVETARVVNVSGQHLGSGIESVLCVPIRDRLEDIRAVVQMLNKKAGGFTDTDVRAFRDFASPLGVIIEAWQRVSHGS